MTDETRIRVDVGDGSIPAIVARPAGAIATVIVAHGAGAGKEHPFMSGFTRALGAPTDRSS